MSGPKSYADDIALGGDRLLAPCLWHVGAKVAWFDIAQALSIEQESWQLLILYINPNQICIKSFCKRYV